MISFPPLCSIQHAPTIDKALPHGLLNCNYTWDCGCNIRIIRGGHRPLTSADAVWTGCRKGLMRYPDINDTDSLSEPKKALSQFMAAMHQWEQQAWQKLRKEKREGGDLLDRQQRTLDRMNEIFAQYCTPKERPYGRLGSFRHPPEYDPETEPILEAVAESPRRVVIYTQQGTGFKNKCRYVLLRRGGKWLLDSKQWQDVDGIWKKDIL